MRKRIFQISRGFTLVEVLLGLTMFSIISVSLYTTFASGLRLSRKAQDANKVYRDVRWSLDQIVRDLEGIIFYDLSGSYPDQTPFWGNKDEMRMIVAGEEGMNVIRYRIEDPGSGRIHKVSVGETTLKNVSFSMKSEKESQLRYLTRTTVPLVEYLSSGEDLSGEAEILSERMEEEGLQFQYAQYSEEDENEILWKDQWDKDRLPLGVRIKLTLLTKEGQSVAFERKVLIPLSYRPRM